MSRPSPQAFTAAKANLEVTMPDGVQTQLAVPTRRRPVALAACPAKADASLPAKKVTPPSTTRAVGQGVVDVVGAGIDVTFGTHWAVLEYFEGNKALRHLRRDAKDVKAQAKALPACHDLSLATRNEIAKNARAQLLFNRYDRYAQRVKRDVHGIGVGTGGLVYGTGMALSSTVFGSFSSAVAAVSTPIALFAGTPILSGACVALGGYESLRAWRMHRLRPHVGKLGERMLVGNELRVRDIVNRRLKMTRGHAQARALAMFTLAAAPPLLVLGVGPGLAVAIPGVIAGLASSYYKHTRLLYTAPLSAAACLALGGRRDIGNRLDLAHREYETLKILKNDKRAFFPPGSSSAGGVPVLRDIFGYLGAVRRWWTPPRHVTPSHHTVMHFLRAQAGHELTYLRQQKIVLNHEASKVMAAAPQEQQKRLAELDPDNLRQALHASLMTKHRVGQPYDVVPSASEVCTLFMQYIEAHHLDTLLLAALKTDKMHKLFKDRHLLSRQDKQVTLKKAKLQAMVDAPTEDDLTFVHELSSFYKRFLLVHEKRLATAMCNQLSEFLLLRTYANAVAAR